MNDFISKPVDRENLISMIAKWLPQDESRPTVKKSGRIS